MSTIPIWLATYPPMVDIPMHATQMATLLRLLSGTEYFSSLYWINGFTPYWSGYVITALWTLIFPVSIAIKCTLSIAVAATPWAASRLRTLVNNRSHLDWLFLPIGYGFAFQWGFFNFIIGIPLTLLFLEYALRYLANPTVKKGIFIFIGTHLLFTTHILLLGFFLSIVVSIEMLTTKNLKQSLIKLMPLFLSLPVVAIWFLHTKLTEPQVSTPITWIITSQRLIDAFITPTGSFNQWAIILICAAIIYKPPYLPNINIFKNWQAIPFVYSVLITFYGPAYAFGTAYICERFGVFLLPFYAFSCKSNAAKPSPQNSKLCFAFSFLILIGNAYQTISFEKNLSGFKKISKIIPQNKKVISLIYDFKTPDYSPPIFLHIASWYFAEKDGQGDISFSSFNAIVRYKRNIPTIQSDIQDAIQDRPQLFNWDKDAHLYDYYILHGDFSKFNSTYKGIRKFSKLIYTDGIWWLYARKSIPDQPQN